MRRLGAVVFCLFLTACGSLGKRGPGSGLEIHDLGAPGADVITPGLPWLALAVRAASGSGGSAVQYRLRYAENSSIREYALARWAAPVPDLMGRRLSQTLAMPTVQEGIGMPCVLWVEVDEFAQVFTAPERSYGSLFARVSIQGTQGSLARQSFAIEEPSGSQNARGGVEALSRATVGLAYAIVRWFGGTSGQIEKHCQKR